MKKTILRKYAQLIAQTGVNVQPGQEVFIMADLDQPEFVMMVVEECYRRKAKKVVVDWDYQPLQKLHYRYRSLTTLGKVENYEEARWQHYVDVLPCRIYLISEDPDGLRGINQTKMAKAQQKRYPIVKPYREAMENKYQWCIAAVPGKAWAKKLFPELRASQAVEKLWQHILSAARVTDDPIAAWDEHNREVHEKCDYLNSLGIEKLHYSSSTGTDFTVGLMVRSRFSGASEKSLQGYTFNPNIPSEECFVSPKKGEAEGIVYATMPLSYQGQLIDKFWIRFHEGKAVEWDAEVNKELLTKLITMDEGSCYLGECALVPYDSPIRNAELLFYNTLFDENAACHLALGNGYADTIQGFEELTLEECHAMGLNESMIHEDFMIGSSDMNIDAICRDGKTVPIFRNGNWAF
ncbi:MAG: aminopeptidase [Oscillospiraceae bacterium]|nr:aminopeptidase [Oscillospiraceae bacterium]